jgi:hypothetical protein
MTFERALRASALDVPRMQARQLLRLVDEHGTDVQALGESFDA